MAFFRRRYGANPLHLAGHGAAFAVALWALTQIFAGGQVINYLVWFAGAALLHDLVLVPLYSLLDRALARAAPRMRGQRRIPVVNHLRVPAAISATLLLVYAPLILGWSARNYRNDTGHSLHGYARNWLLISLALFLGSATVYAIRATRTRTASEPPT